MSAGALTGGAAAAALASAPLDTASCPAMGGCAWSLGVDLAAGAAGLAARLRDGRTAGALWVTTATGFASAADVAAAAASSGRYDDGRAFAVSRDAIDAVVAPMVGLSGDEVMARGLIFGLVYHPATGSAADGSGQPVVGATVTASAGLRIVYPNNMFSGTASATTNQGAFLAVPDAPVAPAGAAATTTTFTVTPPAGLALTWDSTRAAVVLPGGMYFALLYAR